MKIIIFYYNTKTTKQIQVDPTTTIEDIKALCQIQFGIPHLIQAIFFRQKELFNTQTLAYAGVNGLDKLVLVNTSLQQQIQHPTITNPFRQQCIDQARRFVQLNSSVGALQRLRISNVRLYNYVKENKIEQLATMIQQHYRQNMRRQKQYDRQIIQLQKDQLNPDSQRRIQQIIRKKNIQQNHKFATQVTPQSFQRVDMLYINAFINNTPVTAFVDSGAQSSNISKILAQKCNIIRLMDQRYSGTAVGVGTTKILGRIHSVPLYINGQYFPISLSVLDNIDMGFLFGLDMLKRHKCVIDLSNNKLIFTQAKLQQKFLNQGQIYEQVKKPLRGELAPVYELMEMGLGQKQANDLLIRCNGNLEMAKMMIIQARKGY